MADAVDEPSQEQLVNFYADNVKRYYSDRKLTFEQVFFTQTPPDSQEITKRLRSGASVAGEPFWLGRNLEAYGESTLRGMLGARFVDALRSAPLNEWTGPLRSPRGVHFVRLKAVVEPEPIPYDQVREQVEEQWFAQRRGVSVQEKLEVLRKAYDVKVEG
jgi:peptidyl-prolyl cis-trans isomerase C